MTVLIAGAGPTGLTAACGLMQRGVPVRVLDAAEGPATTSRALGVQPRGGEVLNRVDALGDLPGRGMDIGFVKAMAGGRPLMTLRLEHMKGLGMLIGQSEIEKSLRDRLSELGGKVEWGTRVTAIEQDEDGVTVRAAEPIRGDWLLGCDGAHSAVRKLAGIAFPGVPLTERFLLADVHMDWPLDRGGVTTWLGQSGMFAAFPLPGKDLWRLQGDFPGTEPVDVLAELVKMLPARTGLTAEITSCDWTSSFTIHRRLAGTYRQGRVFLAGDAAHVHSPFSGQGMNTGIGDAENLAWKLAMVVNGRAPRRLLDTYEQERRPIAEWTLGTSAEGLKKIATAVGAGTGGIEAGASPEHKQLGLGYPDSPLSRNLVTWDGPAAGFRAPWQESLRRQDFTLLTFDDVRVLVRPDGYIGAVGGPGDDLSVSTYLMDR
jgi:4,5-epoxidase